MKRQWAILAAGAMLGGTLLTGCMERQGDIGNINLRKKSVQEVEHLDSSGRLHAKYLRGLHQNSKMTMSEDIADRLTARNDIDGALVMLTDRNAYVAVDMQSNAKQLNKPKRLQTRSYSIREGYGTTTIHGSKDSRVEPSSKDYDLLGTRTFDETMDGAMKRTDNGTMNRMNDGAFDGTSNLTPGGTTGRTDYSSINRTNEGMVGRTIDGTRSYDETKMPTTTEQRKFQAKSASPSMQYKAVPAERELDQGVKDQVANEVKQMAPHIENVYVSANPDFVGRMQGYKNKVANGHPIQGFIVEFNALVERIFQGESGTYPK